MNNQQNMDERLWEYIDGACPNEERLFIEQLIATNAQWKAKYQELLELQQLLSNHLELDEPSMRFTQNVMEQISQHHIAPAAQSYINKRIIHGIAAFFILSIVGFFIFGLSQIDWSQGNGASIINFDKIGFSKMVNNTSLTIFMMLNAVLGLVWLDMYLNRKKSEVGSQKSE